MIFHYHLYPGGVTNVIQLSVRALITNLPELSDIVVACGSEHHVDAVYRHINDHLPDAASKLRIDVIPELYYAGRDERGEADGGRSAETGQRRTKARELKQLLLKRYGGRIWWIHNYHLGKNPAFTQALLEIARERPEQRMLLHVHDFPECSRYDNLALLERQVTLPRYPVSGNVRYAVINERDRRLLVGAGMDEGQVSLLNNPVPDEVLPEIDRKKTKQALEEGFGANFPAFTPGAPFLFYPVRTIRRKNALEAALVAALSLNPVNLIITLPGISEREAPYSHVVEQCFREGLVPGLWGIGGGLAGAGVSFRELAAASDVVVSSSVQEGFGYLFIDARQWHRPIFARRLDVLDGIMEVLSGPSTYLYREISVPVDGPVLAGLRERYHKRIASLSQFIPGDVREALGEAIDRKLGSRLLDFSFLTVHAQTELLRSLDGNARRSELQEANRDHLEALERLVAAPGDADGADIDALFGFVPFARKVSEIFASFTPGAPAGSADGAERGRIIERNLVAGFAVPEYLRLIYE